MDNRKHEKQQQHQILRSWDKARRMTRHLNWKRRSGFGLNEIIGAAIAVMIAALVIVPGLRSFSQTVIADLNLWWETISGNIFAVV